MKESSSTDGNLPVNIYQVINEIEQERQSRISTRRPSSEESILDAMDLFSVVEISIITTGLTLIGLLSSRRSDAA